MRCQKFRQSVLLSVLFPAFLLLLMQTFLTAQSSQTNSGFDVVTVEKEVMRLMKEGNVPGVSLIVINGDNPPYIKGFGYADVERKKTVTTDTLFELGSMSKAYTGLAAVTLKNQGKINFNDPVSTYLPWFSVKYKGKTVPITLFQLLHHTSGIPTGAIAKIPRGADDGVLERTIRGIVNMELKYRPGEVFEYSTLNYDVIALVIQQVAGVSFESYMIENVLKPLGLTHTLVGVDQSNPPANMAVGYKISFFKPRAFVAPMYRANVAAGYIVSDSNDMARWLQFQLGLAETPLNPLLEETHTPDMSVPPMFTSTTSYALGWMVNLYGHGSIFHGGYNPNFTSYMIMNKSDRRGVVVLANSNTNLTQFIGMTVFNYLYGRSTPDDYAPGDSMDKTFSVVSFIGLFFLLITLLFYCSIFLDVAKKRRQFDGISIRRLFRFVFILLLYIPFLIGIYLIPKTLSDASWDMALVWSPGSFKFAVILILGLMALSYLGTILSSIFPHKNRYFKSFPTLLILSLISGLANAVIIFIITGSIFIKENVGYILYYFALTFLFYIFGRKFVQSEMLKITLDIVYDMRMKLIGKIFFTTYQRFERIESGRMLATLNNDTGQVANSAGLFVGILNNTITIIAVFMYLATIAFWATMVTVLVIVLVAVFYFIVGRGAQQYLEAARETQNVYMELLNSLARGFKELSLHVKKKINFKADLEHSCDKNRTESQTALVKLINAFLVGESLLILILGAVGFAVPRLFPEIKNLTLMSFIIALLYLIGPINGILGSIPGILQIKVAWNRVQSFINDIPANMNEEDIKKVLPVPKKDVQKLEAFNVFFEYQAVENTTAQPELAENDKKGKALVADGNQDENAAAEANGSKPFKVGPISLDCNKGEIVFIVGGNGSGKTTLAKLLTGLYTADEGFVKINGVDIPNFQMGEYFSVVFGDFHLFKKLYDVDLSSQQEKLKELLDMVQLTDKLQIENNEFSTINLSSGQRKRLALLQCYMEDSPIYLFDEVAADQDPQFRKFFYRTLLAKMKADGKIVIAITHDDHYFDVADKVIKMDFGQIDFVTDGAHYTVTK